MSEAERPTGGGTVPWWLTNVGLPESEALAGAIRRRCINQGPLCLELEQRLARHLEVPFVVLTTSGSAALLLSLMASGVGPGDEVILPAGGFIAAAHAARVLGAAVKLVDVRMDRPVIDSEKIRRALSPRTKVIVPMHLNGAACDLDSLKQLVAGTQIRIVEDTAQAFCSRNRHGFLGTQGDYGAFSMSVTKLITTGEGGFVAVRDETAYVRLLKLRNQGVLKVGANAFDSLGFNLRFNDMQAAVGLAQLEQLSQKLAAVGKVHRFYSEQLADLDIVRVLEVRVVDGEVPLWTQVLCAERDMVVSELAQRGIEARPFHPCLGDSPHLDCAGEFPAARFFASHGLTLPSGPDQHRENLERTVCALREIAAQINNTCGGAGQRFRSRLVPASHEAPSSAPRLG